MNKTIILAGFIVIVLIISFVGLNIMVNYKLEEIYVQYYNTACKSTATEYEFLIGETAEKAELCENTDGCFIMCGTCLPKQKLSVFKTLNFFKKEDCITLCTPQCVCPYSYKFNSIKGCIKPVK